MFLTRKLKKEGLEKEIIDKDLLYGEGSIDDDKLSCNTLEFKNSFLGSIKFETISKRRNSYANRFRKKLRLSQNSSLSNLTY